MIILLKNKHTLKIDDFYFKCCIGKKGITRNKFEGDKKTPAGTYEIGDLYYRKDRISNPNTKLRSIAIKPEMGWCNDSRDLIKYNKLINIKEKISKEKLFRKDFKYDLLIPIKYNYPRSISRKGSCIFLHLTKNYKPTAGCIALSKRDFLILLKIINKNTNIKIS